MRGGVGRAGPDTAHGGEDSSRRWPAQASVRCMAKASVASVTAAVAAAVAPASAINIGADEAWVAAAAAATSVS